MAAHACRPCSCARAVLTRTAADAAFHHGKVGDGPLIRSRVKLLEEARRCSVQQSTCTPHLTCTLLLPRLPQGIANFDFAKGMEAPNAFVLVHDMREAPLASVLVSSDASSGIVQMVKTANEYYPDMSVKHVFLYPPTMLSALLLMLKPFLSSRTQRKLLWAPHGSELLTLLQLMPLSAIPARHGGFGGLGPPAGEVAEADVAAGQEHNVTLRTMGEGNEAHWLVSVTDHSIDLRVEFVPLGADKRGGAAVQLLSTATVVVGDASIAACTGAVEGSFVATQAGNVRLTFDNAASWVTAKHVFYAAGVRAVPLRPAPPAPAAPAPSLFSTVASQDADAPPGSAV